MALKFLVLVAAVAAVLPVIAARAAPPAWSPARPAPSPAHQAADFDVDVVIVGAGMSGVAAAGVLAQTNVTFVVLEATNRTGGRVISRAFGDPSVGQIRVETGANWVHGVSETTSELVNPVWTMAQSLKLRTIRVPGSTSNLSNYVVYGEDGARAPQSVVDAACDEFARAYDCANATGATLAPGADANMHDGLVACGWVRDSALARLLEWEGTASDASIPALNMSLRFNLPDGTYSWYGPDDHLVLDPRERGYASVVDLAGGPAFVPQTDARVQLNTVVTAIDATCEGVTVATADGRLVRAKHAIVTLPFGVLGLRHSELFTTTPLPADQAAAMALRTRGNFTKIFMQWTTPFWDPAVKDFLSSTMLPAWGRRVFGELHNLNHPDNYPGSNVLFMAVVDPLSILVEQATDEEAQGIVLRWLGELFPQATIPPPVDFYVTRHGVDPLAYSSYSTVPFGYTEEMFAASIRPLQATGCPAAAAPLPTVFFAGEATCRAFNGYVHSAYVSGQAAGASALEQLGFGPAPPNLCNRPVNRG